MLQRLRDDALVTEHVSGDDLADLAERQQDGDDHEAAAQALAEPAAKEGMTIRSFTAVAVVVQGESPQGIEEGDSRLAVGVCQCGLWARALHTTPSEDA